MDFQVFICYKRDTAKDFAEHLKKGLSKEAFLDIEDIPKACSGTEKWSDSVNEAIKRSNTIALILTVGSDSSMEIKRELSLARKTGNKKFIYFRHKEFDSNTTLILNDGPLDLGSVEQIEFDTKEELLRKAYTIIKKNLKEKAKNSGQVLKPGKRVIKKNLVPIQIVQYIKKVNLTLEAMLLDKDLNQVDRIPVRELHKKLPQMKDIYAVVFDGVITQHLTDIAAAKDIKYLVAPRCFSNLVRPSNVKVLTFKEIET